MKTNDSITNSISPSNVKDDILKNLNKQILITEINKRNNKIVSRFKGQIVSALSNLFVVNFIVNGNKITKTYSYSDVSVGIVRYEIV